MHGFHAGNVVNWKVKKLWNGILFITKISFSIKLIHVSELGNGQTHASDYLGFKDETLQAVPKSSKWSNDFPGDNVMKLNANPEAKKKNMNAQYVTLPHYVLA